MIKDQIYVLGLSLSHNNNNNKNNKNNNNIVLSWV